MADIASLSLSSPSTTTSTVSAASTTTHSYSSPQPQTPKSPEIPPSTLRLWRPQAHRNLRNQWSKLSSSRHKWDPSSKSGRAHANALANSFLHLRYMDAKDLGVLNDMPNIRKKACSKLLKQLELHRNQLLSSYKAMVAVVIDMTTASKSMRCFSQTTSGSAILQFSNFSENSLDTGDGGGAPVVTFLSISAFEMLAEELVEMFKQELVLKRLLVVELLSVSYQDVEGFNQLSWADELYHGEADDLNLCNLYSKDTDEPFLPKISGWQSRTSNVESEKNPNDDVLQVYLTTWFTEVNIDSFSDQRKWVDSFYRIDQGDVDMMRRLEGIKAYRLCREHYYYLHIIPLYALVEEIFVIVGKELRTSFS